MAKYRKNAITHGATGKYGDMIVFRQLAGGRTIMTQSPTPNPNKQPTTAQVVQRMNFQKAVLYGQMAIADAVLRELYEEEAKKTPGRSAFNVAVADYSQAPSVDEVDVNAYNGKPGDVIKIMASDDFMVKEVKVTIYNPDGSIADEGMAEQDGPSNYWIWTARKKNDVVLGDKIVVTASDLPGKIATLEQEFI